MKISRCAIVSLAVATLLSAAAIRATSANAAELRAALVNSHVPQVVYTDSLIGKTDASKGITLDLVLHPRDQDKMNEMIQRVSDPRDPMYGHYLTPEQFRDMFGPAQTDVAKVEQFATSHGFQINYVAPSRTYVQVSGTIAAANSAFGVTLHDYKSVTDGHIYHSPNSEPTLDATVAPLLTGVIGLSNAAVPHWYSRWEPAGPKVGGGATPDTNGTGPNNDLSPYDTSYVYDMVPNLSNGVDGGGQILGLFELGTYTQSDIDDWCSAYDYTEIPISAVSVDGYNTHSAPGGAAGEFTLDIDMLETWAFGATQIRAYENNDNYANQSAFIGEAIDNFAAMANDSTRADVISVSYGISENSITSAEALSEGEQISQLALQGQTVCVASGDAGAFTSQPSTSTPPNTSDPASQPLVTAVGGTDLTDRVGSNGYEQFVSETSWFDSADKGRGKIGTGSGGGISQYWGIPYYQVGSFNTSVNTQGSTTNRNVPDVSLFGDYDTGFYSVVLNGSFGGSNGTSAACPLWAALLADVNQLRKSNGLPDIGFANPAIYQTAESSNYSTDFYDIADGSTNGYYRAVAGYDNNTGWGTVFNGTHLVDDLAATGIYAVWSFSTSAATVKSGSTLTGTLTLPLPAAHDELFSVTSSKTSAATVPATVTVPQGSATATFKITAKTVTVNTKVNIEAAIYGIGETIAITVTPPSSGPTLSSVSLAPTTVTSGATSTGTVTLSAAPTANTTVTLSSSNTAAATVPGSVVVDAGNTTATFTVTSKSVTAATNVTITATLGSVSKTATLTVDPASSGVMLSSVSLTPTTVTGGATSTGTVTLTAAPTSNKSVTLTSSNTSVATVPASVLVKAGNTTATFTVTSLSVTTSTTVTITAKFGSISKTATLTVNPSSGGGATLSTLTLNPATVTGGNNSTGTVTLSSGAPSGGAVVTLSSSNKSDAAVPASVTVAAGKTTATFTINTASVLSSTSAIIKATYSGVSISKKLTINQ